jgi:hypothetical protein
VSHEQLTITDVEKLAAEHYYSHTVFTKQGPITTYFKVPESEPTEDREIEYVFPKTKWGKLDYKELIGPATAKRPVKERKTRTLGKAKQTRSASRSR